MKRNQDAKKFEAIRLYKMRKDLPGLLPEDQRPLFRDPTWDQRDDSVPLWVTVIHVLFMAWTIFNALSAAVHTRVAVLFRFCQVTSPFQNRIDLKPALLVSFFLGGLAIHGGVQGWWIEPVLGSLFEVPLMLIASILTAFNDNAAITYLGALAPGFTDSLKYAVVAGAVAGGSRQAQSLRNRRSDRISLQDLALDSSGFHGYFNSDQNQFSSFIPLTLLNSLLFSAP